MDYEKEREENIRKNLEKLQELNIPTILETSIRASKRKRYDRKQEPKKEKPGIVRRSLRTKGLAPDGLTQVHKEQEKVRQEMVSEFDQPRKPGPIEMVSASEEDKDVIDKYVESARQWLNAKMKKESKKAKASTWSKDIIDKLRASEGVKVVPKRAVCLKFHPVSQKEKWLIAVTDSRGSLGLLHCSKKGESAAPIRFNPHTNLISDLQFNPHNADELWSTSYDGSLRRLNLEKKIFDEVYVHPDEFKLTSSVFAPDFNTLYLGDHKGSLLTIDIRENKLAQKKDVHRAKIGSLSLHPHNSNILATSSNDRSCAIWDLRKVAGPKSALTVLPHALSVSSGYFSPDGSMLLTTSMDDHVRVFPTKNLDNVKKWNDSVKIKHNNQTGRWITTFRARWAPDGSVFAIGNMGRRVDLFTVEDYDDVLATPHLVPKIDDNLTAIPAVNTFHPTLPIFASATASGYVIVWS